MERGYTQEAIVDTILRRMPDYVNYICPQFVHTHVNFQRVPTVDTSNPFIARDVPSWTKVCLSSAADSPAQVSLFRCDLDLGLGVSRPKCTESPRPWSRCLQTSVHS